MKMELIEGSETSAIRTQTLGNYPKENILHIEQGESLKSRILGKDFAVVLSRPNLCQNRDAELHESKSPTRILNQ